MAVALFTSRIVLQALGAEDYGLNNVVAGVIVVFSTINNSMATSTSRFLTFELGKGSTESIANVFSNAFNIHLFIAAAVFVLGEIFGIYIVNNVLSIPPERLFACNVLYQFVVLTAILTIAQVPFNALIISYEEMNVYAYIGIFDALAKLLIAYLLTVTAYDRLITYGLLNLVLSVVVFGVYFSYCKRKFGDVCRLFQRSDKQLVKEISGFSVWNLLGSYAVMLRKTGVNILINVFFGSLVNAANGIAYQVNAAITNFTNNFTTALNPQIVKTYAEGNREENKKLIFRGGRFSFFLLMILCYPVLFETDTLLTLWLDEYPDYTVILVRLVLILSLVEVFNPSIGCAIQATGKIRTYQLVVSGLSLLNFPLTYVLFRLGYPPYAALSVSIVISAIAVLSRLYFIKVQLGIAPCEYLRSVLGQCMLVGLLCLVAPLLVTANMSEGIGRLLVLVAAVVVTSVPIIYFVGMSRSERKAIASFVQSKVQS